MGKQRKCHLCAVTERKMSRNEKDRGKELGKEKNKRKGEKIRTPISGTHSE